MSRYSKSSGTCRQEILNEYNLDVQPSNYDPTDPHPPGRRRPRSRVRPDGYETWTMKESQYFAIRGVIEEGLRSCDEGHGVLMTDLILLAEERLTGHPDFESGRFTNWIRWVKVDLEVEGYLEVIPKSSPQRLRVQAQ